jgi:hypothetical protein
VAITPSTIPIAITIKRTTTSTPEDRPRVAPDQVPTATEGGDRARARRDDGRRAHRPERQQDQTGHDDQDQPERDPDPEQDSERDQRQDGRSGAGEDVADPLIAPAVAHVLHELHDEADVQGLTGQADGAGEEHQDHPAGGLEEPREDPDDDEHDDRAAEQRQELLPVDRERLVDDISNADAPLGRGSGFHAHDPKPSARCIGSLCRGRARSTASFPAPRSFVG